MTEEKVLYVGVSPKPFKGKGYWYLDRSGTVQANSYVWVKMGRHETEQIVYVDKIAWFPIDEVPYPLDKVKCVLRLATEEESREAAKTWAERKY